MLAELEALERHVRMIPNQATWMSVCLWCSVCVGTGFLHLNGMLSLGRRPFIGSQPQVDREKIRARKEDFNGSCGAREPPLPQDEMKRLVASRLNLRDGVPRELVLGEMRPGTRFVVL